MSIASSLKSKAISKKAFDSWELNLAKAIDNNIDLSQYEHYIQSSIVSHLNQSPSNLFDGPATIPVVFHLVLDDVEIISPSKQTIDFNIRKILKDINKVYSSLGITFFPVIHDHSVRGEGKPELDIPGMHIIDASRLVSIRRILKVENNERYYSEEGVTVTKNIWDRSVSSKILPDFGYPLEDLYSEFSWGNKSILNIFLINTFSFNTKTLLDAPNPFVFDHLNLESYNITLPFYALGNPYKDSKSPGYGYKYTNKTKAQGYINRELTRPDSERMNIYQYYGLADQKAKLLVKAIGHALGLATLNTFNYTFIERKDEESLEKFSCNQNCIYTNYINNDICFNCDFDTIINKNYSPLNKSSDEDYCDYTYNLEDSLSTNPMSYFLSVERDVKYTFTPLQILRIKANIGLQYIDPTNSGIYSSVLRVLIRSNVSVYSYDILQETDCKNKILDTNIKNLQVYHNLDSSSKEKLEAKKLLEKIISITRISNSII